MVREGWKTINMKRGLLDEIEKILRSEEVRKEGITNTSQFVDVAVRELMARLDSERLSHMNTYDNRVKIIDNKLERIGRIVSVYFKKWNGPWCDYCEERACIHIQFAWELPEVRRILKRHGLKPPPSRTLKG